MTEQFSHPGNVLICKFLEGLFEKKEEDLETHLGEWLDKLITGNIFQNPDYEKGINLFLKGFGELESDVPKIAKWFFTYILQPLFNKKILAPKDLNWPEPNDEMSSFDAYFKVAAEILKYQNRSLAWKEISANFEASGATKVFEAYTKDEYFSSKSVIDSLTEDH